MKKDQVAIIVPVYKDTLSELEQISLSQLLRVLRKYPIFFVGPQGLSVDYGEGTENIPLVGFQEAYFASVAGYSRLLLNPVFYRCFNKYEYILIYQLDAFVFNDRLLEFCSYGYDYWGAPVYRSVPHWQALGLRVGNGGLSLRKVSSAIRALEENKDWVRNNPFRDVLDGWEDLLWSSLGARKDYDFTCPPVNLAVQFSVQDDVCHSYKNFKQNNPFGCHGWSKPEYFERWQKLIEGAGFEQIRGMKIAKGRIDWRKLFAHEYLFHRQGVNTNLLMGMVKREKFARATRLVLSWLESYPDNDVEWTGTAETIVAVMKLCLCYDREQKNQEIQNLLDSCKLALIRVIGAPGFQLWLGYMVEDLIEFAQWDSGIDEVMLGRLESVRKEFGSNVLLRKMQYTLHIIEIGVHVQAAAAGVKKLLADKIITLEQLQLIAKDSTRNPNEVMRIIGQGMGRENLGTAGYRESKKEKICFIACVNDEEQFEKFCLAGLRRLVVPEGMTIEVLTIDDASSMTSGYEKARLSSNAKYKVYLHQDVEIVNPYFIRDLLEIFSREPSIGIVGMIGASRLCSNGAWWDSLSRGIKGGVCCTRDGKPKTVLNFCEDTGTKEKPYETVEAVDGLLLATQYDIPWRANIICNYHYYDISQCLEYRRHGYQLAVPRQENCWVIHHEREKNTYSWLYDWDIERRKCLREYWTELMPEAKGYEKQVEILIIDHTDWEGTGKYDYLRELIVPDGYGVNITFSKGSWRARDYREFQEDRPAKYRIYIAEGTKIRNRNFLLELLEAFVVSDRIGCIGVSGRNCRSNTGADKIENRSPWQSGVPMVPVDMIDGGFIAAQQPVPWDDVRYCGDSFVTEGVCLDLARRGYLSMVVRQEPGKEWVEPETVAGNEITSITLENICNGAQGVSAETRRFMQEWNVINFRDRDIGEIFRREYEPDWGKVDKRLPDNRTEETPLISVVMPVWNAEKFIGAAIESVLAQTYENFELLLVEDCPADSTPAVVAAYAQKDKRLRVLKNDRNRGISYTTNRAIAAAKGKYIALLDDDDQMTPWRLELQVAYLEDHPEIDILGGASMNIYDNGKLANRLHIPPRLGYIHANLLLNTGGFANGTGMIRRNFIIENHLRYRDNACGIQDMKFYMDASPLGRFDAISDVLLYSRQHGGQETKASFAGERARRRVAAYAQFQRESLAAHGIFLSPVCMNLLNRICDESHLAVCKNEKELRQFTAVIEEIYRQAAAKKLWFLEEAGACLASRIWEQCDKLGVKEPPKVYPADLPQ